jgi:flagellar basal body-associated protein FliL
MNLEKVTPEGQKGKRSKLFWALIAAAVVAVIIVIVVPLAVLLPRRNQQQERTPSANIIIPLYLYPLNETSWKPVYDA